MVRDQAIERIAISMGSAEGASARAAASPGEARRAKLIPLIRR